MHLLILTGTHNIVINTSILTLHLKKTMALICTPKKDSIQNQLTDKKTPGGLTAIRVMASKIEINEMKNRTIAIISKLGQKKSNQPQNIEPIHRGLA